MNDSDIASHSDHTVFPLLSSLCLGCAAAAVLQAVVSFILLSDANHPSHPISNDFTKQTASGICKSRKAAGKWKSFSSASLWIHRAAGEKVTEDIYHVELCACVILSCWNLSA